MIKSSTDKGLENLAAISAEKVVPELSKCNFRIACDVNNPLCGERGCSAVYAPQKGASPEAVKIMDAWLAKYAETAKKIFPSADAEYPGSGAAGGLGFAFMTFLGGVLESGISIILDETELEAHLSDADVVVYGHTDSTGNDAINNPLSVKRAEAVANFLLSKGVAESQIKSVEGFGSTQPVADNATAEGRAENRRVEIFMYASAQMIEAANNGTLE